MCENIKSIARKTCKRIGFASNFKTKDLTPEQITIILRLIDSFDVLLNNQLKMLKFLTLKSLTAKKSYRGLRRTLGLPVRGQRTHTNARSAQRGKSKNTN